MLNKTLLSTAIFCAMSMGDEVVEVKESKEFLDTTAPPIDLSDYKKPVNGFQTKQRKRKAKRRRT
ncbi:MAG: hypothetical protein AXW14_08625 [Alteromonas sp. Nap_26]|nr:MAG: hypothetical protein AXW14_08625 [Alteromonas sp. Nap_26]